MRAHLAQGYVTDPSGEPDPQRMPTSFLPPPHDYGFPGRKEREMVATQQQMNDAQLMLQQWDYCAHYLIRLLKCKRDSFPNFLACKHEQHDWEYCEHLDYVMRMKEFERERRLLQRKKQEAAGAERGGEGPRPGARRGGPRGRPVVDPPPPCGPVDK